MYRNTPHSVTGISPAELLFKRKLRTKLPSLPEYCHEEIVRDRDKILKQKGKDYADVKRHASYSPVVPGDKVLVKQEGGNKLSTTFHKEPFTLLDKSGNSVVVRDKDGVKYKRNSTFVKKFEENNNDQLRVEDNNDLNVPVKDSNVDSPSDVLPSEITKTQSPRPSRNIRIPVRFNDYVLDGN